jgi:hypothetical protein
MAEHQQERSSLVSFECVSSSSDSREARNGDLVPRGNADDPTRNPADYGKIYKFLKDCGIQSLIEAVGNVRDDTSRDLDLQK